MIHFVTTAGHSYTLTPLIARHGSKLCKLWSYEQLFRRASIPTGTWIFTDHERLSARELARAGLIATALEDEGARVLNHPARVRSRFEILRRLKEEGINTFSVLRGDSDPIPSRFPVFIRNEYDHGMKGNTLLTSQGELDAALWTIREEGRPLVGKLVIEYAGKECMPNIWHRMSTYRIADQIIAHHMAFDEQWVVKDGFTRAALAEHPLRTTIVDQERDFVTNNLHSDILARAFAIAGIDYGRLDFSVVEGQMQIFEINTNPSHGDEEEVLRDALPERRDTQKRSEDSLHAAIAGLDQPSHHTVRMGPSPFARLRRAIRRGTWRKRRS